jgi:hypothetical protein
VKAVALTFSVVLALNANPASVFQERQEQTPGDEWTSLSSGEKSTYAQGWVEGENSVIARDCKAAVLSGRWEWGKSPESCFQARAKQLRVPSAILASQFVDGMNYFYSDHRNWLIPIADVARDVDMQITGASEAELEADLESQRRFYAHRTQSH